MFGALFKTIAGLAGRLFAKAGPTVARLAAAGGRVAGNVGNVVRGAVRLFDKGKSIYGAAKSTLTDLPIIGSVAQDLINTGEQKLENLAKEKIGIGMSDINKGVETARSLGERLPGSENR